MLRTRTLLLALIALSLSLAACGSEISEGESGSLLVKTEDSTVTDAAIIHFGAVRFGDNPSNKVFWLENTADEGDISINSVRLVTQSPSITLRHGLYESTCSGNECVFESFLISPRNVEQFDLSYSPTSTEHDCGTPPEGKSAEYCGEVIIESSDGKHPIAVLELHVSLPSGQLQVCLDTNDCGTSLNIDFATALVGDAAQSRSFTVENVGGGFLRVTDLNQILTPAAEFTLTGQAPPYDVAPGERFGYELTFEPQSDGIERSGSIIVTSNASANPTATISVSVGNPNAPSIEVFPAQLDFTEVNQGSSATKTLSISNNGGPTAGALTVDFRFDPSEQPDYTVTNPADSDAPLAGPPCAVASPPSSCTTPFVVPASNSKEVAVTYTPTTASGSDAVLRLVSNDPSNGSLNVPLSGSSGTAFLTVTPATVAFADTVAGTPVTETLTLTNEGTAALTVSGVQMRNFSPAGSESLFDLSVDFAASTVTLQPSDSTTVDLTFNTDASSIPGQSYLGDVVFLHNGVSGETIVSVSVTNANAGG